MSWIERSSMNKYLCTDNIIVTINIVTIHRPFNIRSPFSDDGYSESEEDDLERNIMKNVYKNEVGVRTTVYLILKFNTACEYFNFDQ